MSRQIHVALCGDPLVINALCNALPGYSEENDNLRLLALENGVTLFIPPYSVDETILAEHIESLHHAVTLDRVILLEGANAAPDTLASLARKIAAMDNDIRSMYIAPPKQARAFRNESVFMSVLFDDEVEPLRDGTFTLNIFNESCEIERNGPRPEPSLNAAGSFSAAAAPKEANFVLDPDFHAFSTHPDVLGSVARFCRKDAAGFKPLRYAEQINAIACYAASTRNFPEHYTEQPSTQGAASKHGFTL